MAKQQALMNFSNEQFGKVRVVLIDNEPYFVGKDVATALGYSNPQKAIRDHVDSEDRTVNESFTVNGTAPTLINESGLYSLILSSKLPTAKKFKRWVTSEVLPSIRKTGSYSINRDDRWQQTRLGTKKSHKPFSAAIKLLIEYLRQFGDNRDEGFFYGHITNLVQNACGIIKGQRDFSDVSALNKCDQCQIMIANVILNAIANHSIKTLAEMDALIILQLNQLNQLLGGQSLLLRSA